MTWPQNMRSYAPNERIATLADKMDDIRTQFLDKVFTNDEDRDDAIFDDTALADTA